MKALKRTAAVSLVLATATILAGCLHGHHAEEVVYKPMKLGAADTPIGQSARNA